jgi:hypothetical protein
VQTENNKADKSRANKSGHFHVLKTHTRTGRPLGPDEFLRRLENQTGRKLLPQKRGRRPHRKLPAVSENEENQNPEIRALFG